MVACCKPPRVFLLDRFLTKIPIRNCRFSYCDKVLWVLQQKTEKYHLFTVGILSGLSRKVISPLHVPFFEDVFFLAPLRPPRIPQNGFFWNTWKIVGVSLLFHWRISTRFAFPLISRIWKRFRGCKICKIYTRNKINVNYIFYNHNLFIETSQCNFVEFFFFLKKVYLSDLINTELLVTPAPRFFQ